MSTPAVVDIVNALANQQLPPGLLYVAIRTPLGDAYVDPGAVSQDQTTQEILDRLGVSASLEFGAAPEATLTSGRLTENIGAALFGLGAVVVFVFRPKLSTAAGLGLAWLALGRPGISMLMPAPAPAAAGA